MTWQNTTLPSFAVPHLDPLFESHLTGIRIITRFAGNKYLKKDNRPFPDSRSKNVKDHIFSSVEGVSSQLPAAWLQTKDARLLAARFARYPPTLQKKPTVSTASTGTSKCLGDLQKRCPYTLQEHAVLVLLSGIFLT